VRYRLFIRKTPCPSTECKVPSMGVRRSLVITSSFGRSLFRRTTVTKLIGDRQPACHGSAGRGQAVAPLRSPRRMVAGSNSATPYKPLPSIAASFHCVYIARSGSFGVVRSHTSISCDQGSRRCALVGSAILHDAKVGVAGSNPVVCSTIRGLGIEAHVHHDEVELELVRRHPGVRGHSHSFPPRPVCTWMGDPRFWSVP